MAAAATDIERTPGSTGNRKIWTFSAWLKRGKQSSVQHIFGHYTDANNYCLIGFKADDTFYFKDVVSSTTNLYMQTSEKFRDNTAWYNFVVAVDTPQDASADRVKIYVNGLEITAWVNNTYPAEDYDTWINYTGKSNLVGQTGSDTEYFDGCMSWVQLVDGTALAPTAIGGSTDATSGTWKIKPGAYGTPGTNGFCLAMEDRSNLDLDTSSNAHTFTTSGTLTPTMDNPSNSFCTMNNIQGMRTTNQYLDYSETDYGNNSFSQSGDKSWGPQWNVFKGFWYWEIYYASASALGTRNIGITRGDMWYNLIQTDPHVYPGGSNLVTASKNTLAYTPKFGRVTQCTNDETKSYLTESLAVDGSSGAHYVGIYLDMTNGKVMWALDGTLLNSGTSWPINDWNPNWQFYGCSGAMRADGSGSSRVSLNTGNGVFATTALTGSEDSDWFADAGGEGRFKYNPTQTIDSVTWNCRALCTKNLKTYGN